MSRGIAKEDLRDLDIVDARELLSSGFDAYQSAVGVVSVVSATKTVVVSGGLIFNDNPVETGDRVTIAGNAAAGDYTVDSVLSDTSFTVVEAIVDASGGTATFKHPPGALKVGIDPTNLVFSGATNLQEAVEDLDSGLNSGHKTLRHLIHFINEGPAGGFATGAYKEVLPAGDPFPITVTWWESSSKLKKIVDKTITYNANKIPTTIQWRMYDTDGSTVLSTVTDTITYVNNVFESTRTRAIT